MGPTWRGALADLGREHGFEPLRVEGEWPDDLPAGTLWRNGPARVAAPGGERYRHWFDGDGAVTAVRMEGGAVWGAVRLVESRGLMEERAAGRRLYAGYGTPAPEDRRREGATPKNAANTGVMWWQERLYALMEAGLPTEIDVDDLGTRGESTLGGAIGPWFSAHPHAVAGDIFGFGMRYGRETYVDLCALPGDGVARRIGSVQVAPTLLHDFAVTARHAVFLAPPLRLDGARTVVGYGSFADNLRWAPAEGSEVIVVPLAQPDRVIRFAVEPFFQWHFANAFEDRDGDVVVDLVRYRDFGCNAAIAALPHGGDGAGLAGTYVRARISPAARRMVMEDRLAEACEFPRVAGGVEGARHRFTYLTAWRTAAARGLPDRLIKLDVERGSAAPFEMGDAPVHPSEPIFVARRGGQAEDDGYLLSLVYDATMNASHLAVLDARTPARGVLARAWFDQAIPYGFHGTFAAAL